MAMKANSTFRDRGNNGWGEKKNRIQKNQPEVKVIKVLAASGKMHFERV